MPLRQAFIPCTEAGPRPVLERLRCALAVLSRRRRAVRRPASPLNTRAGSVDGGLIADRLPLMQNAPRRLKPPSAFPMLRFSRSITRWLLAAFAVSVALAWPLHEAMHADTASGGHAATWSGLVGESPDDGAADPGDGAAGSCLWCLAHAEHHAPSGSPPALRFHAEASSAPPSLSCGLPVGRCPLAAHPRGPPLA